jgi:hypothetical protein
MKTFESARDYAIQVAQFFGQHGLDQAVFVVKGPTSTTKQPFEVVEASAGYTIAYRTRSTPQGVDQAPKVERRRSYRYQILVEGVELMRGDDTSISVIFGNLDGRNFTSQGLNDQTHSQWLAYMAAEFQTSLVIGASIEMVSPEGAVLAESCIGKSMHADANLEQA